MPETEQVSPIAEAVGAAELSEAAMQCFRADMTASAFANELARAGLFPDAVKFLAVALGARRSVIWASACTRELQDGGEQADERTAALVAVDEWLADGTDEKRRATKKAAETAGVKTPEGCIAMAAFFSEGSMAPSHVQRVDAPPRVAERLSAAAVLLSVVAKPQNASERFERCLALGLGDVKT